MKCNVKRALETLNANKFPFNAGDAFDNTENDCTCCICGGRFPSMQSNNPYPVREESWFGQMENRCCNTCNRAIVLPARRHLYKFSDDDNARKMEIAKMRSMNYEQLASGFTAC